jgi:hypothetical protein
VGNLFDFDGQRLAWTAMGCTEAKIIVRPVSAKFRREAVRRGCALRFKRPARQVGHDGIKVSVDCFGFVQKFCRVRDLVMSTSDGEVVARSPKGQVAQLTKRGRKLLAGGRSPQLRTAATLTDAAGRHEWRVGSLEF